LTVKELSIYIITSYFVCALHRQIVCCSSASTPGGDNKLIEIIIIFIRNVIAEK